MWGGLFAVLASIVSVVAPAARAQSIVLRIKPHVGDTLRMRLDQESEMSGVKHAGTGETSTMVVNSMQMFSRAIVEAADEQSSTVLAVTDSVRLRSTDEAARANAPKAEQQLRGQHVRFRVSPDGTVGTPPGDNAPRDVAAVVSLMPAAFPRTAVTVGESWTREMPLPESSQLGAQLSAKLRIRFRLDSLTHEHQWAFVSMHGELEPATGPGANSAVSLEKGVVDGTMLVDQKRGWLTESWFKILVSSIMTPPAATGITSMSMQMRVTQHMRTADRR